MVQKQTMKQTNNSNQLINILKSTPKTKCIIILNLNKTHLRQIYHKMKAIANKYAQQLIQPYQIKPSSV